MKLQDLHKSIRDTVDRIGNSEVDSQPDIKALLASINEADAAHRSNVEQTQALRSKLDDLDRAVSAAQQQIEKIRQERPALGLRIFLGEIADSEDRDQQASIIELTRRIELMGLARPLLENKISQDRVGTENLARIVSDLQVELEQRRLAAKVELARARA